MKANKERAERLNAIATRMMIEGNVERYLRALHLLFTVRRGNMVLG